MKRFCRITKLTNKAGAFGGFGFAKQQLEGCCAKRQATAQSAFAKDHKTYNIRQGRLAVLALPNSSRKAAAQNARQQRKALLPKTIKLYNTRQGRLAVLALPNSSWKAAAQNARQQRKALLPKT